MSERLIRIVNDALIRKGMEELVAGSGLSKQTIHEIAEAARVPRRRNAFKLALACGLNEADALALARECIPAKKATKAG